MATKFSIITPCRNAARYLPETIESILGQSAVASGQVELEYLIVDGASTDSTAEVEKKYQHPALTFCSEPDTGVYDALAKGLQRATGDIVAYLNAGDCYHPKAFEVLAEVFANPGVDWVTGYSVLLNEKSQVTAAWKPPRFRREYFETGLYCKGFPYPSVQQESTFWSAKLNRTIDFARLRQFRLAGDYFLWTSFAPQAPMHSVFSYLSAFRIHAGQLSEDMSAYNKEVASITRPLTRKEKLSVYWEYTCHPLLRGPLSRFVLPRSEACLFEYDGKTDRWKAR